MLRHEMFVQDGPDLMAKDAKQHNYTFPYLYDATQDVAKVGICV